MCIIESDVGHTTRTITNIAKLSGRILLKLLKSCKGLTPVDPAGPDCYQSETKPCESTYE